MKRFVIRLFTAALDAGITLLCAVLLVASARTAGAAGVVGTGTAASCTDAALNTALTGGGLVTFNCGGGLVTIDISPGAGGTGTKSIAVDTTIDGGSLITISGGNSVGVFSVDTGVNFTVQNLTIASAFCGIASGGTLTVTNSTFSGNSGESGGGISSDGTLTVTNSTFSGNSGFSCGGGIYSGGTLTVTNSTFSGNSAYYGGGICGGVYSGPLTVTNSTFSGNSASEGGGGIIDFPGAVTVTNTIVANSTSGGNCAGSFTDGGHNIDDGTTCGFSTANGSLNNTNPKLDPTGLQNNGGPTQTIALQAGSPAINAGNESVCAAPPVNNLDQRGFVRPGTGATNCSIGAYEHILPGTPDCCQCPSSCAAPVNGSCGSCGVVFNATCEAGSLCVLHTPGPTLSPAPSWTPTLTPTPTRTPITPTPTLGANACCQCADFCAAPIDGTCGACTVVLGASCTGGSLCTGGTPPPTQTPTLAPCVGDCDGGGSVTVNEIITLVNIALGSAEPAACAAGIPSGSQVNVALIIQAVNNALNGCG